jgi:serine/threonine-protein kinase
MLGRRFRFLTFVTLLAAGSSSGLARAEASAAQKVAAEALFDDALKLMRAGKYTDACPKLEESQRLDPGIGTLMYLGECYENVGRSASAWASFREAASRAGAEGQTERARSASERATRLEPKLAYLTIRVAPETRAIPGLSVRMGQSVIGAELFGTATPVDPGATRIEVVAPGRASFSATLNVDPGNRYEFNVPMLAPEAQPAASAAGANGDASAAPAQSGANTAPSAPEPATSSHSNGMRTASYIIGGAGLLGIGVGSVFGLQAISKNKDATDGTCKSGVCQDSSDYDKSQDAHSAATLSNVFFGVGGAALATGVVLFLLSPSSAEHAQIVPYATASSVGISVGGKL